MSEVTFELSIEACFLIAAINNGLLISLINNWIKKPGTY